MDNGLKARYESIVTGQLPGSEIVIGLVGPVGTNLNDVVKDLAHCLSKYSYDAQEIHLSNLIGNLVDIPEYAEGNEYERANAFMTAGNNARHATKNNAILALAATSAICENRTDHEPVPRQAYVINSLKHPDEVNVLRRIYGDAFFLLGVYVEPDKRRNRLIHKKNMSPGDADALIRRDEAEALEHGQHTRDTFHLSDFFVHLFDKDEEEIKKTQATLERILDVVFADPYRTPLFDEYAMFMAFAAATRSADLSRQIGAVIARGDEILASGANDCPKAGGGTYWPALDDKGHVTDVKHGRDCTHGRDRNDEEKARIIQDAMAGMKDAWANAGKEVREEADWDLLKQALTSSTIDDITEYGRVVHAEMDALLTCARNNISCRCATLYTTTFPCHNCAKHIIAAGISRVVYVEPYPKSKALEFHSDAVFPGFDCDRGDHGNKVAFEPFVGVGPRRFFDLFSMKQGSGFPLKRKDKNTGRTLHWHPENGTIRVPELPWSYLERESIATNILNTHGKGLKHVQQGPDSSKADHVDPPANADGHGEGG